MLEATNEAIARIETFSSSKEEAASLRLYLSEIPTGDEYDLLSADEWRLGERFEAWLTEQGIKAFMERPSAT